MAMTTSSSISVNPDLFPRDLQISTDVLLIKFHLQRDEGRKDPADCGKVLDEALAAKDPVIIEAVVDACEPPMPPKATLKQGYQLAKALVRGESDGGKIIATILEDKVKEMI